MKKSFFKSILFFSAFLFSFALTGCETEISNANDFTGPQDTYNALYELSGTSWILEVPGNTLTKDTFVANGMTTTHTYEEINMSLSTSEITFNSDGTFTATLQNRYTAEWDARYADTGNIDYSTTHQSTIPAAAGTHTGYANNFCNGTSNITITGIWKKVKYHDETDGEYDTWKYQVKPLTRHTYEYTVTEAEAVYNTALEDIVEINYTYDDWDADWEDAVSIISTGSSQKETEVNLSLLNTVGSYLGSGCFTLQ